MYVSIHIHFVRALCLKKKIIIHNQATCHYLDVYADDTSLTYASADLKSIDNCINYDLNGVYIWLSANKLTLNLTKTEVLLIASRQKLSTFSKTPSFSINDYTVKEVSSTKSLGVLIDQNLNWECQIQSISKKIASALGAIKRISHLLPFSILMNVYNGLVQSHFDYCNVVWGTCGIGLSDKLQKLQNRATRILMYASYDCNVDDLFRVLGWRKLKHQRLVSTAIMMYKTLHGMTPECLRSRFLSRDDITTYRLRNTENKLALPQPRTNYLKKSFSYSGAALWNSLSQDLRSAASLNDFKTKLSHHSFE